MSWAGAAKAAPRKLRILFVGPYSPGSNAGALARSLSEDGHAVQVVDPRQFVYRTVESRLLRIVSLLLKPSLTREFNRQFVRDLDVFRPELVLVFKGETLTPASIGAAKEAGAYCINFFPDQSLFEHGRLLPKTIALYDHVFTTKSFGPDDLERQFGFRHVTVLHHGFDPYLHRPVAEEALIPDSLRSDASFIGTWSPRKERFLQAVVEALPTIDLKIWGSQWDRAGRVVRRRVVGHDILGTVYPLAIQGSRVNIALLREAPAGASSGDRTTSRTFHIPAASGFLLHERTTELLQFFTEDLEVGCFDGSDELCAKIRYFLEHDDRREAIRLAGHRRCIAEHSIGARGRVIVAHYLAHRSGGATEET